MRRLANREPEEEASCRQDHPKAGKRCSPDPALALFATCVVDALSPRITRAATKVLGRLGFEVVRPRGVTCCGQPAWNSGFVQDAAAVARTTLNSLLRADSGPICVLAGSCTTMMRVYWPEMFRLAGDPDAASTATEMAARVVEFSELVAATGPPGGKRKTRAAYHRSCHMLRELHIDRAPQSILAGLDGCVLVEWQDDLCCGFGGAFAVKEPEVSTAMADAKIESLLAARPDELVGCDRSCLTQIESRLRARGIDVPVRHLAEVLAEAMDGASP